MRLYFDGVILDHGKFSKPKCIGKTRVLLPSGGGLVLSHSQLCSQQESVCVHEEAAG